MKQLLNKTTYNNTNLMNIWETFDVTTIDFMQNPEVYVYYSISSSDTLLSLSKNIYNTSDYFWVLLLVNNISSPFDFIKDIINEEGGIMKAVNPLYINELLIKISITEKS